MKVYGVYCVNSGEEIKSYLSSLCLQGVPGEGVQVMYAKTCDSKALLPNKKTIDFSSEANLWQCSDQGIREV